MYRLNNIKQNILIVAFAALLTGCGGGGGGSTTSITETPKVIVVQTSESVVTENSAIIEWIENDYTAELIEYGTNEQYGSELLVQEEGTINYKRYNSELLVENAVTLSNLEAGTTYNYRIVGKDRDGKKVVSNNKTFRTPEPTPVIESEPTPEPTPMIEPEPTPEPTPVIEPEPTPEPTPVNSSATAQLLYDDMYLDHEGYPHGVPSYYDFALGTIIRDAEDTVGDFQATTGWGQVYEEINGNPSVNTRVELKNYKVYYLSKSDNQWHALANVENINEGAGYLEDFSDDTQHAAPSDIQRFEANGHVSTRPGSGYNYHFYTPRVSIDPSDIAQLAASCDAKLILGNTNGVDDRHLAKFVLNIGLDAWRTMDAEFKSDYSNNHDMGMGRFKYVTNEWRKFTFMTDMPLSELQENPPPL